MLNLDLYQERKRSSLFLKVHFDIGNWNVRYIGKLSFEIHRGAKAKEILKSLAFELRQI